MSRACVTTIIVALTACEPAESELQVRVYGEAFIEEGIPADVFADGWALRFDRFLVSPGEARVSAPASAGTIAGSEPLQVSALPRPSTGAGQLVASAMVPVGAYREAAYQIAPYVEYDLSYGDEFVESDATAEDRELMKTGGFSVYVAGAATKGAVTKTFAWGFATRTSYSACEADVEVEGPDPDSVEITVHGDHLFYDDLFAEEPNVAFDLVAGADVDGDGAVTRAELEAVDLRPLANYQVGSTGIVDLWRFIEHQTTTLGHINGEGHCQSTREE